MTAERPDTDLHAVTFALADYATVENGKVYIGGGFWSALTLPSYPAVASFYVVAVLRIPWRAYHQDHKFAIYFEDADKNAMEARFEGEFRIGADPQMRTGDPTLLPIASQVSNFLIQHPGDYACVLQVDGSELAKWPFRAVQSIGSGFVPPGSGNPPPAPDDQPR